MTKPWIKAFQYAQLVIFIDSLAPVGYNLTAVPLESIQPSPCVQGDDYHWSPIVASSTSTRWQSNWVQRTWTNQNPSTSINQLHRLRHIRIIKIQKTYKATRLPDMRPCIVKSSTDQGTRSDLDYVCVDGFKIMTVCSWVCAHIYIGILYTNVNMFIVCISQTYLHKYTNMQYYIQQIFYNTYRIIYAYLRMQKKTLQLKFLLSTWASKLELPADVSMKANGESAVQKCKKNCFTSLDILAIWWYM